MKSISSKEIVDMVNQINESNSQLLSNYLDKFFEEYLDIEFFDELTFTGEEHMKIERAITHLVQIITMTSVQTTVEVLKKLGIVEESESDT